MRRALITEYRTVGHLFGAFNSVCDYSYYMHMSGATTLVSQAMSALKICLLFSY